MVQWLDIGKGQKFRLDAITDVGTFHEELLTDLVSFVVVLLGEDCKTGNFMNTMFILILFKKVKHVFVNYADRQTFQKL